jgi:hypothetical protein
METDKPTATEQFVVTKYSDGSWTLDQNDESGNVWPQVKKTTPRQVVARLMQLLEIGPVAPQITPEEVCIGEVFTDEG